jgi:uncharacterized membrane protein
MNWGGHAMDNYVLLLVSAVLFVLTHLGISRTSFRNLLVDMLTENGYLAFYSIVALATLGALIYQYGQVGHQDYVWEPSVITSSIAKLVMPIALIFIVLGMSARNPTSLKMESSVDDEPLGILRITRHPVQWGILLWALSHLVANGDVASIIFLVSFALVSGLGTSSIDRKRRLSLAPEKWNHFISVTSNVPFAAILSGRNQFKADELGWSKIIGALVLFVVLVYFHEYVSAVPLYQF